MHVSVSSSQLVMRFSVSSYYGMVWFICQGAMDRVEEGEVRLTQVCEEGEKLLLHLPKASAGQVQQHLSSIQQDWDSFVEQCRQNQQILEDSASLIKG